MTCVPFDCISELLVNDCERPPKGLPQLCKSSNQPVVAKHRRVMSKNLSGFVGNRNLEELSVIYGKVEKKPKHALRFRCLLEGSVSNTMHLRAALTEALPLSRQEVASSEVIRYSGQFWIRRGISCENPTAAEMYIFCLHGPHITVV